MRSRRERHGNKNFWSLSVDEAIVADRLQAKLKKDGYEVFFPLRAQLKDIDLLLVNLRSKQALTIQVKGSRTYPPQKREVARFGHGQGSWFVVPPKAIFEPAFPVDVFIFLVHLEAEGKTRCEIETHYVVVPSQDLRRMLADSGRKTGNRGKYDFYIWINPRKKTATEFREWEKTLDFTPYLNNFEILRT